MIGNENNDEPLPSHAISKMKIEIEREREREREALGADMTQPNTVAHDTTRYGTT